MTHALVDLPQAGRSFIELCRGAEYSVLFGEDRPDAADTAVEPAYFSDLNLGQVAERLAGNGDKYTLTPLFCQCPDDVAIVRRRQDVFAELRRPDVRTLSDTFSAQMRRALSYEATVAQMRSPVLAQRWHLRAAEAYCRAVSDLVAALASAEPTSDALRQVLTRLETYRAADDFADLEERAPALQERMRGVRYEVFTAGDRVTVGSCADEAAWERQVLDTFARFRPDEDGGDNAGGGATQARISDREPKPARPAHYDSVRQRIVDQVVKLQPEVFDDAEKFCNRHRAFLDPTVVLFYRELQFYLGYLDLVGDLEEGGLAVSVQPQVGTDEFNAQDTYDLALALQMQVDGRVRGIVTNDVEMSAEERILVVTGPNQGGKTTMARTIGQLHHLAWLGCPVPGTRVELGLPDDIFTHFDRAEVVSTQGSKLEEDLRTVATILAAASSRSLVILNETFSSTTARDALELGENVLRRLEDIGCRCVYVTFIDELSRLGGHTVSMAGTVDPADPARRTLKVVRRRADGRAYAASLAAKYQLTYQDVKGRIGA